MRGEGSGHSTRVSTYAKVQELISSSSAQARHRLCALACGAREASDEVGDQTLRGRREGTVSRCPAGRAAATADVGRSAGGRSEGAHA